MQESMSLDRSHLPPLRVRRAAPVGDRRASPGQRPSTRRAIPPLGRVPPSAIPAARVPRSTIRFAASSIPSRVFRGARGVGVRVGRVHGRREREQLLLGGRAQHARLGGALRMLVLCLLLRLLLRGLVAAPATAAVGARLLVAAVVARLLVTAGVAAVAWLRRLAALAALAAPGPVLRLCRRRLSLRWREKSVSISSQTRPLHASEGNPTTRKGTGIGRQLEQHET